MFNDFTIESVAKTFIPLGVADALRVVIRQAL
jgi:hypothetical protein